MDSNGSGIVAPGARDQVNRLMETQLQSYPRPAVPLTPVISWHSTRLMKQNRVEPSILDCKYKLNLTSGRAAIALALEHACVSIGDEVLIPAFHCESMVAPVRWCGAKPVFYQINAEASINIQDILRKITPRTRAIIATHYFGFLQKLQPLQTTCRQNNIKLIEDCAHAFFGHVHNQSVGAIGDYAIASSMKFFPVLDGGLLASNTLDIGSIPLQNLPTSFQFKSLLNSLEKSIGYRRFGLTGRLISLMLNAKELIWTITKALLGRSVKAIETPASSSGGQQLDENWIRRKASLASRTIVSHSDMSRIIEQRRKNYKILDRKLKSLPGCRPVYPDLPSGCVPLVYPLYIDEPEILFQRLKQNGVPIWRFGEYLDKEVTEDVCINSVMLSAHVFQFPCHQELRAEEITWIIDQVTGEVISLQEKAH